MTRRASSLVVLVAAMVATSSLLATRNAVAGVTFTVTFTVNSTLDQPDDLTVPGTCHTAAGTCTLRAAVMQANRSGGAAPRILLPAGLYPLTIPIAGPDDDDSGDLNLYQVPGSNPVVDIVGAGANATIIDANHLDGIFRIAQGRTLYLSGVTLRNGSAEQGGAINNSGTLTVTRCAITGNLGGSGGGILNEAGTLTVSQSTISANHGSSGGGIYNNENLFVVDSTISENDADTNGGGIYNGSVYGPPAIANVYSSTIVFNGADADADPVYGGVGGGVYNGPTATFNLRNSLVAGNIVENAPVSDDCNGTLSSYGRNLIGELGEPAPCTINVGSGTWTSLNSTYSIDILRSNGGPTKTHALLPGSNAIDGGDPTFGCTDYNGNPIATDQRGAPRVTGVRCDIGAFEVPEPASMAAAAVAILTLVSMRRAMRGDR